MIAPLTAAAVIIHVPQGLELDELPQTTAGWRVARVRPDRPTGVSLLTVPPR